MRTKAVIIGWEKALTSLTFQSMIKACKEFDIILEPIKLPADCNSSQHYELIAPHKNVISWVYYGQSIEEQKTKRNMLFLENAILDTSRFFYIDDNGYGTSSNIVAQGYNTQKYPEEYQKEVFQNLSKIGWEIGRGYQKDGPILVCLQSRYLDDLSLLTKCEQYLPKNREIVIRPHPSQRNEAKMRLYNEFCDRNGWSMDKIKNVLDSIKQARVLVVNFSTIMYKAMAMDIPVAACMRGFHSGTTAILDCSRNPSLLKHIEDYQIDKEAVKNLICSVHKNSMPRNLNPEQVLLNTNFANWLKRIYRD